MSELADELHAIEQELLPPLPPRRRPWRVLGLVLAGLLVLLAVLVWSQREQIADNLIADQLEKMGLPATYEVESIGASEEVLRKVVIGDPARPDLTIERVVVAIEPRFGTPAIGRITLFNPRLYGTRRAGKLSFGALDKVLFTQSKEPFRLPDLDVRVVNGRALMDSDYGRFGIGLEGEGKLRGGFSGQLAAIGETASVGDCRVERPSLYGKLSVSAEKPRFAGPLRLHRLTCGEGVALTDANAELDAIADPRLDGGEAKVAISAGASEYAGNRLAGLGGTMRGVYRGGALTLHHQLAGKQLRGSAAQLETLALDGTVRAADNFARIDAEGEMGGGGMTPGAGFDASLGSVGSASEGTLFAPLLAQARAALRREAPGSRFAARYVARRNGALTTLILPQASLRGGSGDTLLALSRFQVAAGGAGGPRISGNFTTGGGGLPRIAGRIEQRSADSLTSRLTMAEYHAAGASLAIPTLMVVQQGGGALSFTGEARLSGALPGGLARGLVLPLKGDWSASRGLAMWRQCATVAFDHLTIANLALDRRKLTLCPPPGGAIVRSDAAGMRLAAGAPALNLSGRLGQTPIRIASGPVGFAMPGAVAARAVDVWLGPADSASRFHIANLAARSGGDIAGTFAGADVLLAAVPLDLHDTAGRWRYAGGVLSIDDASFRLEDRQHDVRFRPLVAQGGKLSLANDRIVADAVLREPGSGREVVRADIVHNLGDGRGYANLSVPGLVFDKAMQPDTLSRLALGVIANASGTVTGTGRIDWTPDLVTSSGRFRSTGLDFAAAFGPVHGAAGEVEFTDLLGLVTAPDQRVTIAGINPGIEVNDGTLDFELRPDYLLAIKGASWPFLDGKLTLRPVNMTLGASEVRRYELVIEGLNAARFLQRMELSNISATGTFDGVMPLVFDENGGRIEGGQLVARPPGGNVSYVGALTYKDLSPMANFAFDTLKSLDYRELTIGMDGAIAGEIVTRAQLKGVRQGDGARRSFLTRSVANLPIQFNVNLRAPFFQIISSFKAFYDPSYLRDPMSLGLLGKDGKPQAVPPNPVIQPSESETKP